MNRLISSFDSPRDPRRRKLLVGVKVLRIQRDVERRAVRRLKVVLGLLVLALIVTVGVHQGGNAGQGAHVSYAPPTEYGHYGTSAFSSGSHSAITRYASSTPDLEASPHRLEPITTAASAKYIHAALFEDSHPTGHLACIHEHNHSAHTAWAQIT